MRQIEQTGRRSVKEEELHRVQRQSSLLLFHALVWQSRGAITSCNPCVRLTTHEKSRRWNLS